VTVGENSCAVSFCRLRRSLRVSQNGFGTKFLAALESKFFRLCENETSKSSEAREPDRFPSTYIKRNKKQQKHRFLTNAKPQRSFKPHKMVSSRCTTATAGAFESSMKYARGEVRIVPRDSFKGGFMPVLDTVVVSDVHLGSSLSLTREFVECLDGMRFKRLILNGDMFDDLNFNRLKKDHWEVLSYLRRLSNPKLGIEVVWVMGNHDPKLSLLLGHMVGIEVRDRYEWEAAGLHCIAIHGHQFDPSFHFMGWIFPHISRMFQHVLRIRGLNRFLVYWKDSIAANLKGLSRNVENGAVVWARTHDYDVICCGHTHKPLYTDNSGVVYCNSGSWVKESGSGTYIAFAGSNIQVKEADSPRPLAIAV
jgi:UDP-2,3-diacylglucosamine pyrophosphatase LpxH